MGVIIKHEGNALELHELTEGQEKELVELATKNEKKRELQPKDTLCANCLEPILWIKHGWPLSMVEKIGGCCCPNNKCKFYCVFIPNRIAYNLTINQKQ